MEKTTAAILAIVGGVIGLAVISVLVSPKAQTPTVLNSAGGALSNVITAAVSPVTGTGANVGGDSSSGLATTALSGLDNLYHFQNFFGS